MTLMIEKSDTKAARGARLTLRLSLSFGIAKYCFPLQQKRFSYG